MKRTQREQKKFIIVSIALLMVSALGLYLTFALLLKGSVTLPNALQADTQKTGQAGPEVLGTLAAQYPWWDNDYSYFRQITLTNNSPAPIQPGTTLQVSLNHKELVQTGKSLPDGKDLHIVKLQQDRYEPIHLTIAKANSQETTISFQAADEIATGASEDRYFLYYGNKGIEANEFQNGMQLAETANASIEVSMSNEAHPRVFGQTNRTWILKNTDKYNNLVYSLEIDPDLPQPESITYTVHGSDISGTVSIQESTFSTEINIQNLQPGKYAISASYEADGQTYESQNATVFISHPIFVAMTLDWEGSDVTEQELQAVQTLSDTYNLPYTQYFNPRIYLNTVVKTERAEYLTNWILNRQENGDQIALHLHMHFDLVETVGLEPIKEPQWTDYIVDGHDVPGSAYTYEEFKQLLNWSKETFEKQGLGTPTAFRAGGWFADEDNLRAMADTGFLVDSSGREYYIWGKGNLHGHWTLNSKTQPYYPCITNQNASCANNLSLLEVPNNGADFNYYKPEQIIQKFRDNYSTQTLSSTKVFTLLSHPHGFDLQNEDLETVFSHIDKFSAVTDNGPVIYATHEDIYGHIVQ